MAKHFETEIISADSRQFYKEMNIGTAKPSPEEMQNIKHHFINSHSIHEELTAGKFANAAAEVLKEIFKTHDVAIVVGGSGMYIDALTKGLDEIPTDNDINLKYTQIFLQQGISVLQDLLKTKDPEYYEQIDLHNPMRLIRALEAIEAGGKKLSELRKGFQNSEKDTPWDKIITVVINHDREVLYNRINERVDNMLNTGLEEEVRSLIEFEHTRVLQTVGYSEFFEYFKGVNSKDEAIEKIKQNTRRYAKRQITWFKRNPDAYWIDYSDKMTSKILNLHSEITNS